MKEKKEPYGKFEFYGPLAVDTRGPGSTRFERVPGVTFNDVVLHNVADIRRLRNQLTQWLQDIDVENEHGRLEAQLEALRKQREDR